MEANRKIFKLANRFKDCLGCLVLIFFVNYKILFFFFFFQILQMFFKWNLNSNDFHKYHLQCPGQQTKASITNFLTEQKMLSNWSEKNLKIKQPIKLHIHRDIYSRISKLYHSPNLLNSSRPTPRQWQKIKLKKIKLYEK